MVYLTYVFMQLFNMVKQTIKIFGRIKPTKPIKTGHYEVDEDEDKNAILLVVIPREFASGFVNNKREHYKFRFEKCFDQASSQDEIFKYVAKPVIDTVLQGYNGTVFAYGQTGSGKTFTITGGAERYVDRGLIPRSLSYLYSELVKISDYTFTVHVSYLEIYNDNGYDILNQKHDTTKLEDLPKVMLFEDSDQNIHLKNLSIHPAVNEEEALNLLFLGDTNRMIAETPMNQASSRSHCIFTTYVTAREIDSATIRRAKLHLVDLAGSERVSKTNVNGVILNEAKYINSSLHFLELVIISLSEKNRHHVPYRNSMMTSVLRDSLGGNCMTTMIATCSMEKRNMDESISTCRFAQRVAMIKNDVLQNEELDPKLMISKLQRTVQELRQELQILTSEQRSDELTPDEILLLNDEIQRFLDDQDSDSVLNVGADMRKMNYCFSKLKHRVMEKPITLPDSKSEESSEDVSGHVIYSNTEHKLLQDLLVQRDNEIISMLKKEKQVTSPQDVKCVADDIGHMLRDKDGGSVELGECSTTSISTNCKLQHGQQQAYHPAHQTSMKNDCSTSQIELMSTGRQKAFDIFFQDYEHQQSIEENKQILKHRYKQAKLLGQKLNNAKEKINHLKQQALEIGAQENVTDKEYMEVESKIREEMESEKQNYREAFVNLRAMKTEIEHLQHLLEKAKMKTMKDFEFWWSQYCDQSLETERRNNTGIRDAWKTPPVTPVKNVARIDFNVRHDNYSTDDVSCDTHQLVMNSQQCDTHIVTSTPLMEQRGNTFTSRSPAKDVPNGIPLTGDAEADAEILAFVRARQTILTQQAKYAR